MRIKLKDGYLLRGWQDYPYALIFYPEGKVFILNELQFQSLSFCDGSIDVDSIFILEPHKKQIKNFLKNGIVEKCDVNNKHSSSLLYKNYNCRFIKHLHWAITRNCNYKCKHCYMSSPISKYEDISFEKCVNLIEQFEKCGIYNVSLTGGEPFVRPDIFQIIKTLKDKHINVTTIYTNGFLINESLIDKFTDMNINPIFSISFDGLGCHDWMRGIDGAEEAAIRAIELLVEKGFKVDIEMCLNKKNANTIESTIDYLSGLGVGSIKINRANETGEWVKNNNYNLTIKETYDLYLNYIQEFLKKGSPVTLQLGGFFYCAKGNKNFNIPMLKFCGDSSCSNQYICQHARNVMYINPDGYILPCVLLDGIELNVPKVSILEKNLEDILSNSAYSKITDTTLDDFLSMNSKCEKCKYSTICGGGCRAYGAIKSGNYFESDENSCVFFKGGYMQKIQKVL